ncbi:MAG: pyridine nucleotide-disulfide oxidoreductase [Actinobacteria bacterium]|nr:MAG: pyridine nucleotide-disulfide oxidoreductase [Actinomycetota bacterium]
MMKRKKKNKFVRTLLRRGTTPVNKRTSSAGSSLPENIRRLPQIDSPILIGAIGVGAIGVGAAVRSLRPAARGGRTERFRSWISQALFDDQELLSGAAGIPVVLTGFTVEVLEGFGKPPLVSFDLHVDNDEGVWSPLVGEDLLSHVTQHVWDNPEIAPVAIRGRVIAAGTEEELADMSVLGFDGEIARPADLYGRYGPPASDPTWKS